MKIKVIARLICELIESRDWTSWKGEGIKKCTYLTRGQVACGIQFLAKKGYIKRDQSRGRGWWIRKTKFCMWKLLLGVPKTKLDMSTGKLKYA